MWSPPTSVVATVEERSVAGVVNTVPSHLLRVNRLLSVVEGARQGTEQRPEIAPDPRSISPVLAEARGPVKPTESAGSGMPL